MTRLIFGCGYLGSRVANHWLAAGDRVVAVTRSQPQAAELRQRGIEPLVADVTRPETLRHLPAAETVLYAVGFDRQGAQSRRQVYADGLRAVLDALPAETRHVIFVSSTGVYGQCDGQWVDEDSPCRPIREAGRALLAAEQVLSRHRLGPRSVVLRLAGIYGPGRLPHSADILAGRPIAVEAASVVNLIQVDDAAVVVLAAEARVKSLFQGPHPSEMGEGQEYKFPRPQAGEGQGSKSPRPQAGEGQGVRVSPEITVSQFRLSYVVSDGHPVERRECYRYVADLLGMPPPQFIVPSPDSQASQRSGSNKRLSNARMLAELGVRLIYPTYKEGISACLRATG